jgi:hypothetical protein
MALGKFFDFSPAAAERAADQDASLDPALGERIVTAIAVSAAVLIVAGIAVLMGTIGP